MELRNGQDLRIGFQALFIQIHIIPNYLGTNYKKMKFKYEIQRTVNVESDVLEKKIVTYLTNNFYRITEKGDGYIIFTEDDFSNRQKSRSDFHTRIGESKFVFSEKTDGGICLKLIYLTSYSYYVIIMLSVTAFGIYTTNIIIPLIFSVFWTLPILLKMISINGQVFHDVLNS